MVFDVLREKAAAGDVVVKVEDVAFALKHLCADHLAYFWQQLCMRLGGNWLEKTLFYLFVFPFL